MHLIKNVSFEKPHLNHPRQRRVTQASLLYKEQCWCVCLFSIEIQTAGRIQTKFGTKVVLEGGKVLGGFQPGTTHPKGMVYVKGYRVPLEPQPCVLVKTL